MQVSKGTQSIDPFTEADLPKPVELSTESSSGLSGGEIAAAVICSLIGAILIAVGVFFYLRKKKL